MRRISEQAVVGTLSEIHEENVRRCRHEHDGDYHVEGCHAHLSRDTTLIKQRANGKHLYLALYVHPEHALTLKRGEAFELPDFGWEEHHTPLKDAKGSETGEIHVVRTGYLVVGDRKLKIDKPTHFRHRAEHFETAQHARTKEDLRDGEVWFAPPDEAP
jgi:hypothetical protein